MFGALLALLLFVPGPATAETAPVADAPDNVLFVGNSFTYFNNSLHGHFRRLLSAEGPPASTDPVLKAMTISGEELSSHEGGLDQMLKLYPWDVVVLQGHSLEAIEAERRPGLKDAVAKFSGMIREYGARPAIFMTWAYRDRPEMTGELVSVYTTLGMELDVMVVPVGLAFAEALKDIPDLELHHPDKIHPSLEGTYLAACVFYAALYGKSPAGLAYDAGLDNSLALELQRSAWRTVNRYYQEQ